VHNVIQISGGIDSMALLFHLRGLWPDSLVMWGDTGASYIDVAELMDNVQRMVPHFLHVQGDQPSVIAEYGWPVDVVPVSHTRFGERIYGPQPIVFQSYLDCCARARFLPLQQAVLDSGAKVVYRGQRNEDKRRPRIRHDSVDEFGITYKFPLRDWSRPRVFEYMARTAPDFIPAYYAQGEHSSHDCWSCTAYRDDNVQRVEHLPPPQREQVETVLKQWRAIVRADLQGA
jgi:3'-phosphoadenosine 5'-phosphosulfate sulfotransferase (PAPS reductase)/FAD synthetase